MSFRVNHYSTSDCTGSDIYKHMFTMSHPSNKPQLTIPGRFFAANIYTTSFSVFISNKFICNSSAAEWSK